MKNRKLIYVLLPVVALIWGLVIYRFMGTLDGASETKEILGIQKQESRQVPISPDTFSLLLHYDDPFRTNLPLSKHEPAITYRRPLTATAVQRPSPESVQVPIPEPIIWPEISYAGVIENKAKKTKVAILRVGSSDFLVSEGHAAGEIKLMKLWQDSVQVEFRKERRVVGRGNQH